MASFFNISRNSLSDEQPQRTRDTLFEGESPYQGDSVNEQEGISNDERNAQSAGNTFEKAPNTRNGGFEKFSEYKSVLTGVPAGQFGAGC